MSVVNDSSFVKQGRKSQPRPGRTGMAYTQSLKRISDLDDCLFGGSILSGGGELLFPLHYPLSPAGGNETESGRASYYCTARVSVTGMSTAQSNPGRLRC